MLDYCNAAIEIASLRKPKTPDERPSIRSQPDHRSVIRRVCVTIIDNLTVDMPLLNELKARRIINDHILADIMTRRNRPQRVICLAEHMLSLGPSALQQCGDAMAKCEHKGLAGVLSQLLMEERDRAWSQVVPLTK